MLQSARAQLITGINKGRIKWIQDLKSADSEIREQTKSRTAGKLPTRGEATISVDLITCLDVTRRKKARDNVLRAQRQQSTIKAEPSSMTRLINYLPAQA